MITWGNQLVLDVHGFHCHFKDVDASLYMKWNPGLIPRLFKSSVNSVKDCIISLSLLFFTAVVRMSLKPYTFMM